MCDIIRNAMGKYLKRLGIILLAAAFSLFLISGPVFAVPSDNDTNPTPDTSEEEETEEEDQEQIRLLKEEKNCEVILNEKPLAEGVAHINYQMFLI